MRARLQDLDGLRVGVGCGRTAGARNRARLSLLAALPLVLGVPARARAEEPSVSVGNSGSGCRVVGTFHVPVNELLAWQVLTDYDHISQFVSSMKNSRVESRGDDTLLVRQDAMSSFFVFHHRVQVLLDVREIPSSRISFRDVLGKDFRDYQGEWQISSEDTSETVVRYELKAEPHVRMPRSMCRGMLRDVARDLLSQVRAEMMRRSGLSEETHP